jgi:hypothetical protein
MQLAHRISLARRVLLLTSAATAHAECAWVLWGESVDRSGTSRFCRCNSKLVFSGLSLLRTGNFPSLRRLSRACPTTASSMRRRQRGPHAPSARPCPQGDIVLGVQGSPQHLAAHTQLRGVHSGSLA